MFYHTWFQFVLCISLAESSKILRRSCSNRCLTDGDCEDPEFSVCLPRIWCQWWFCGRTCQKPPDDPGNPCRPNPCENGGSCVSEGARFKCDCPPEYTGEFCDEELPDPCDESPCVNGDCTRTGGETFTCSCSDGWKGDLCNTGFLCGDESNTCVPFSTICNKTSECPNGFDESRCCGDVTMDFQCGAPTYCIPSFNACDGEEDCVDTDIDETFFCNTCTVTAAPGGGPD